METLIQKLIELRKENGFSQADIAEILCVSRQAVCKWENGQSVPNADNLKLLAEIYGVSVDWMIGRETECLKTQAQNREQTEKITILQKYIKKQRRFYLAICALLLMVVIFESVSLWRIHKKEKDVMPLHELACDVVTEIETEEIDLISLK